MTRSKLNQLRWQLQKLRQARRSVRLGSALAVIVGSLLLALLLVFGLDVALEMNVAQRVIILVIATATLIWAWRKFAAPWLGTSETTLDMAMLVERRHGIESDLVGALQFESPEATKWGSAELESAVIDYVAELGGDIDVFDGFDSSPLRRRMTWAAVILVFAIGTAALAPRHVWTFMQRLALSDIHYPTKTTIESIRIGGVDVDPTQAAKTVVKIGYGQPFDVQVLASGVLPASGQFSLTGKSGATQVDLLPPKEEIEGANFVAQLPRLMEPAVYQISLGDSWTDPAQIEVLPLPTMETEMSVTPPEYAIGLESGESARGLQRAVLEGSRVDLQIISSKPLATSLLHLTVGEEESTIEMVASDDKKLTWNLPPSETPFTSVAAPVRFELEMKDEDGLAPQFIPKGYLRLKNDRAPQIAASAIHRVVLPTAKPVIAFRVSDDYGVASIKLQLKVERGEDEFAVKTYELLDNPLKASQLPFSSEYSLPLSELKLEKGDSLSVTLEARDWRGRGEGVVAISEPLVLEVSDESGVLAAISEADQRSEEQLTEIIKRQLGIGEAR
ncbi:hypothetical protein LOC68_04815 [Blastopirellula sp. JC732]|uniref:Uncharacterized protein n=1 Tax=Blastopirellula sediminis TaxID=2894196 RepID=A0A9X1MJK5_9BACT|nr:hypothetical protein [Blastopirellula sediminis]MCC9609518.1 hypothetical protein [Blastopirellula sediminis]MCC9627706.1 hypothetical protein [Blastopirellula sediminis]